MSDPLQTKELFHKKNFDHNSREAIYQLGTKLANMRAFWQFWGCFCLPPPALSGGAHAAPRGGRRRGAEHTLRGSGGAAGRRCGPSERRLVQAEQERHSTRWRNQGLPASTALEPKRLSAEKEEEEEEEQ